MARRSALSGGSSTAAIKARSIIEQYGLCAPMEIDIEAIAALRGAYVREENLNGCEGRLVKVGHRGIISIKAETLEPGRRRFTIAHELGHFELHDVRAEWVICVEKDLQQWNQQSVPTETEANQFASELLMPEFMFKPLCGQALPSLSLIRKLAEDFRMSLTATALRYISFCPYRCAFILSKRDRLEWFKCTDDFGYMLERGVKLDPDCLATDFFARKELPIGMQPVVASSWIKDGRLPSGAVIKEESLGSQTYESVLSLIWLDDSFEENEEEQEEVY